MKVFISKERSKEFTRFLIPNNEKEKPGEFVEISVDYLELTFSAKKEIIENIDFSIWEIYEYGTFPSSLFNEFIRNS